MGNFTAFDYSDDRTFNYVAQAGEVAHMYGTKLLVKIAPSFPQGTSYGGGDVNSMFPVPDDERLKMPSRGLADFAKKRGKIFTQEEMVARICPKEQLKDVIQEVVDMCVKYKKAGWDGMSYRADRYIDAATNLRTDEYGGEVENRGRFPLELFTAVKEACGQDFLIEIAMMGNSPYGHDGKIPHGYTEEEFIRFVRMVEDVVDIVEVREQNGVGYQCLGYNSTLHDHPCLGYAKHLRQAGFTGTIAVNGGFNDPDEMEAILADGIVDLISTGRTFRAEPRFVDKLRSGGAEFPTPCLRCNKCHGNPNAPQICGCSVNPKNMMTHRLPAILPPPGRSKKTAIIGGGLIGMRTACFAAERGHTVTLFEKTNELGGKARYYAPLYPQQWPMERYRQWLIDEVARRGVQVRLNCAPNPEELKAENFQAVIACTGSREKRPPIQCADAPGVWWDEDVYEGRAEVGENVVIVGGGMVASETAIYLARLGKQVTILTRQEILMLSDARPHGPHNSFEIILPELGYGNVGGAWAIYDNLKPIYYATTKKITPTGVTYVKNGQEHMIPCDTVIVSGGYEPCLDEALRYADCTQEFYIAGDVEKQSSSLEEGNRRGYGKACLL
ncbi:MAG: FAD-dependent oxidoreductase [Oscillospiraceae bacterium]|nr:FAD-dependent oxidoreductase [Oscillospiraceae bacterium]